MAKYNFDVTGTQLVVSLVPVLSDVQPNSMSYLAPSFKIGNKKINAFEYGQPKQSFLFTEIGEIDGVEPTDLQDAFDKLTTATANFNGGGAAPYKVYKALLTQTGTDAPVATVLENTLGVDLVWTRDSAGVYYGTSANVFLNKNVIVDGNVLLANPIGGLSNFIFSDFEWFDDDSIRVDTARTADNGVTITGTDEQLYYSSIRVEVYDIV